MKFEFYCRQCGATTLFKEIKGLSPEEKACANCEKEFSVQTDLMRFDRKESDGPGILIANTEEIDQRIARLTDRVNDLVDRFERLEILILDDRDEDDYVN